MNKVFWSITILEAIAVCVLAVALVFPQRDGGGAYSTMRRGWLWRRVDRAGGCGVDLLEHEVDGSPAVSADCCCGAGGDRRHHRDRPLGGVGDERRIKKYNDDRLMWWNDPGLTRFVLAVYELDTGKVRSLSREVDINGHSTFDNTPLKVAVERAVLAEKEPEGPGRSLEMVRLLLSLGAKPNSGLRAACYNSSRTDAVRLLLEAGADPNNREPGDQRPPAYFACIKSPDAAVGLENLRLMREKGADFRLKGDWTPPIAAAASEDKWEIALFLHESGAPLRDERDGGWIDGAQRRIWQRRKRRGRSRARLCCG